jgi:hypothetical protein
MHWYNFVTNSKELNALFPQAGFTTERLLFTGFRYEVGNIVTLSAVLPNLPMDSPQQWRDRGHNQLAITFDIGCIDCSLKIGGETDGEIEVHVEVKHDQLLIESINGKLLGTVHFFYLRVEIVPNAGPAKAYV